MDYVDFVVHIFSENARKFYDLERLWKSAKRLQLADLEKPARKPAAKKTAAEAACAPEKGGEIAVKDSRLQAQPQPHANARVLSP